MRKPEPLRLGVAPTRRVIFSIEEAARQKRLIEAKLKEWGVDLVTIDEVNPEGLVFSRNHVEPALDVFRREKVDALFIPHVNFGTEDAIARLARDLGKPVLLWGPRDDAPEPDGSRSRDTQCGLFATSKILRRMGVPFSYIINSTPDSLVFERGMKNFLAAAAAVKAFRNARIGQVSTRPNAFWTMMVNEGELLERWGIEVIPATLSDVLRVAQKMIDDHDPAVGQQVQWIRDNFEVGNIEDADIAKLAAFKLTLAKWAEDADLDAIALQCWSALQSDFGIFPCFVHGLVTDDAVPVACETDIHGALASFMVQEAVGRSTPPFFADLTIRHPTDENAELLWHCGPFPPSLAVEHRPKKLSGHYMAGKRPPLGVGEWELRGGPVTIARFDGDHGHYQLFLGHAVGTTGPFTRGTYLWVKAGNWPLWEERLIQGPYVHHVICVHGHVAPALYEACRFLGIQPDCVEPTEEQIRAWLRGEPWPAPAPAKRKRQAKDAK
ncbi:MAG: fucose isomerase [Planctomycetes bacterium]|nr:fucose isomerase [Planctomycetota bacterium]